MKPSAEILLLEDSAPDAELAVRAIRAAGVTSVIEITSDGPEVLHHLEELSRDGRPLPRVIFLDLKVQKLNGLDVLARLRADERTRRVPIVVISSSAEEPDIRRAYDLGANGYIVKPVEFEDYMDTVGKAGFYWTRINRPPP